MRRVVKVGGSLLLRDDLVKALPRWLAAQSEAETLIIVGGGELIDAIRRLDRVRRGDPAETHWMCVELLDATYRVFSQWFEWPRIDTAEAFCTANETGFSTRQPTLVAVRAFYDRSRHTAGHAAVPLDWRTTTDTIAALLAEDIGADELVLLKSCDVDATASVTQLSNRGIVDETLPLLPWQPKKIRIEKLT